MVPTKTELANDILRILGKDNDVALFKILYNMSKHDLEIRWYKEKVKLQNKKERK